MAGTILITGGQLYNKGAQAMTFITVDEIAGRYPDKEIVLLSNMDDRRSDEDKAQYRFRILRFPKPLAMILIQTGIGKWWYRLTGDPKTKAFIDVLQNADAMINISGYALGSNWGIKRTVYYMTMIGLARSVKAQVYLMPQSFGPFAYRGLSGFFIRRMIRNGLAYPKVIMCREKEGYTLLQSCFGLQNIVCQPDLVLQNKGIDPSHVYRQPQELCLPVIEPGSVAVIPNGKTILYGDEEKIYELYRQITEKLLRMGKKVYYVYHSFEDVKICRRVKETYFASEADVRVIDSELSCLEFDRLVRQFDYVIASRFHAIVHAYKNGTPAIALGWATKYRELLALFDQDDFRFDVRGEIDTTRFMEALDRMEIAHGQISGAILRKLEDVRKENVYDSIQL